MAKPDPGVKYMPMYFFEEVAQASDAITAVVFGRLYALVGDDNQQPFLNIEAMARSCNVSRYTIMRCLKDLVAMKLISRHRNGVETYRYMVHFDQLHQLLTLKKTTLKDSTSKVEDSNVQRGKFQHEERCKNPHLNSDSKKGNQMEGKSEARQAASQAPHKKNSRYPETPLEVEELMRKWIDEHPDFQRTRLDLKVEAEKFFGKYSKALNWRMYGQQIGVDGVLDLWMNNIKEAQSGGNAQTNFDDSFRKTALAGMRAIERMKKKERDLLEVKDDA